ncbi:MAG: (Fe-S)-binding protein, partial [Bacteroidetes bacterium]|nr:(Fe-S)-binding protein [Bacteroidota bacterium]
MRTLKFDSFVLPFSIGLLILTVIVIFRFSVWINKLPKSDKAKLLQGIFSRKIFSALKEIFLESLLHRKIFKINPVLGYMHTSLAFGWFLLIVIGNLESRLHNATDFNPPYFPIFFRFFVHEHVAVPFHGFFPFIMDFLLLIVLSGVVLALIKRVYSGLFGMKRKSKLKVWDKVALTALWFIFPMRLMAESFTAGVYKTGGFMTGTLGNRFSEFLPVAELAYISWWAYSLTLGAFFVFLPFSRYMHIPTEVLLIFLRKAGIKTGREHSSYSDIEVYSCPKCGICLDKCQISFVTGIKQIQSVYFLQSVRNKCINNDDMYNCLLCGRCTERS